MPLGEINFSQFSELLQAKGVKRLLIKHLAENDNSKNQIYLGTGDMALMQMLPHTGLFSDKTTKRENFKAKVDFYWLDEDQNINHAPHSQLIFYPDYPEIRFSGFLIGAKNAPSKLMRERLSGRVMFFGICDDGKVIGYVTTTDQRLIKEIEGQGVFERVGVLSQIPLQEKFEDPKVILLKQLKRINGLGWINAKRLTTEGLMDCFGQNCGGLTLEAELGIYSNSRSEPDFMGYEVKQYAVRDFNRVESGSAITLMTPEPQGGLYKSKGVEAFIRKFGYPDKKISDRMNFSGVHYFNKRHPVTGLTLTINGYEVETNKITDVDGSIELLTDKGVIVAAWKFVDIIAHWSRKHNHAAYVPSQKRTDALLQYCYGHIVLLAGKTDPLFLFRAIAGGKVYYDPGIHLDNMSSRPSTKRRNQFRIRSKNVGSLYGYISQVNLLTI